MSPKTKILFVEDEPTLAYTMKRILEYDGFEVALANNGLEALELLKSFVPEIVVCDIMMPEMDGYEFYDAFQKAGEGYIPFIFLTAVANPEDVRRAMNLGADDYLTKPVKREDLLATIKARLGKKAKLQNLLRKAVEKYQVEIAHRDECLNQVAQNQSHVIREPLDTIMAAISLLNLNTMDEENKSIAVMLSPLADKLDRVIRENVYSINTVTERPINIV